jgi:hypothetical protein
MLFLVSWALPLVENTTHAHAHAWHLPARKLILLLPNFRSPSQQSQLPYKLHNGPSTPSVLASINAPRRPLYITSHHLHYGQPRSTVAAKKHVQSRSLAFRAAGVSSLPRRVVVRRVLPSTMMKCNVSRVVFALVMGMALLATAAKG